MNYKMAFFKKESSGFKGAIHEFGNNVGPHGTSYLLLKNKKRQSIWQVIFILGIVGTLWTCVEEPGSSQSFFIISSKTADPRKSV